MFFSFLLLIFSSAGEPIRGVNLGGWFVLEPWITPSIFYQVANITNSSVPLEEWEVHQKLREHLGDTEALGFMSRHWGGFYLENDFVRLKAQGITHVRIPIPYWSVDIHPDEPFLDGNWYYIEQALRWMCKLGLKPLLDLHTGPGSQNGFDNSGHCFGQCFTQAHWGDEVNGEYPNIDRTLFVWGEIMQRVLDAGDDVCVWGIELINEPAPWYVGIDIIKNFYKSGYDLVRQKMGDDVVVVFQEGFSWGDIKNFFPEGKNVMIDRHQYIMFAGQNYHKSYEYLYDDVCSWGDDLDAVHPAFVGEWAGAHTDCAYWLNGVGRGTRYEGNWGGGIERTGSCDGVNIPGLLSDTNKTVLKTLVSNQIHSFEYGKNAAGWFLWTAKTEREIKWDYLWLSENGYVDRNAIDNACNSATETSGVNTVMSQPGKENNPNLLWIITSSVLAVAVICLSIALHKTRQKQHEFQGATSDGFTLFNSNGLNFGGSAYPSTNGL